MDIDTALNELLLTRPVTKDQIKRAYHRMAKRFHPDKATDAEEKSWVQNKFLCIQQAYELLTDISIEKINGVASQSDVCKPKQTNTREDSNTPTATRPIQEWPEWPLFKWCLAGIVPFIILFVSLLLRDQPEPVTAHNYEGRVYIPIPQARTANNDEGRDLGFILDPPATTGNVGGRDLSTPSGRLAGHWRSEPYETELYFTAVHPSLKFGTMIRHNRGADPQEPAEFKVLFEAPSRNMVSVQEFAVREDLQVRLEAFTGRDFSRSGLTYRISEDGQTMTEEYIFLGKPTLSAYHYIDNKTAP